MKTVTLQIGNSDDKLTQVAWAKFVKKVQDVIDETPYNKVHFSGCSHGAEAWQNACWVFLADENLIDQMKGELTHIRKEYLQESIAWTEGDTAFV